MPRLAAYLSVAVSIGALVGCTSVSVVDDDGHSGGATSGGNTASGGATASPDWVAACPSDVPDVDPQALAACSNEAAPGELSEQNAEDLLLRVAHEAGHIASMVADQDAGLFDLASNGTFGATTDDGYASGRLAGDGAPGDTAACAVVEFGCWTGGHGGWGPSALAGIAFIEVTVESGDVTRVRIASESMWLVDSGPLDGTPSAPVAVELSVSDGQVEVVDATIGGYHIER